MFWCISFNWKSLAKLTWICKYVWAALKYHLWKHLVFSKIWYDDDDDDDKSNDNSCYCSGNSTIFFLFLFLHHFFFYCFLSLPTCSVLYYVYFPIYFPLSFPLPEVLVPSWFYISSGAQPHSFISYCQHQILHSVTPVSLNCNVNEIKLHQHKSCATVEKAELLSVQCLDILFVS